ncbi:MAG: hypothetical protein C0483_23855 [Pirellula sp.]|nr:hypothetical protein [Pirellula sp.]
MSQSPAKRRLATILVYVYSNGFAGYAVAPRVEGDDRPREMNLTGTTLPLYACYEIAGDYVPRISEAQTRIGELEEGILALKERGFQVTKISDDTDD